jgi:hypothetical protein
MEICDGQGRCLDNSAQRGASNQCVRLIRKLRWMGMGDEAERLLAQLAGWSFQAYGNRNRRSVGIGLTLRRPQFSQISMRRVVELRRRLRRRIGSSFVMLEFSFDRGAGVRLYSRPRRPWTLPAVAM